MALPLWKLLLRVPPVLTELSIEMVKEKFMAGNVRLANRELVSNHPDNLPLGLPVGLNRFATNKTAARIARKNRGSLLVAV